MKAMQSLCAFILMAAAVAVSTPRAMAACEAETIALNSCLANSNHPPRPKCTTTCIPDCTVRASQSDPQPNGTCLGFGPDYCGVNPSCIQVCTRRASQSDPQPNGTCLAFGSDLCTQSFPGDCDP